VTAYGCAREAGVVEGAGQVDRRLAVLQRARARMIYGGFDVVVDV
jgi:hypothetical protein